MDFLEDNKKKIYFCASFVAAWTILLVSFSRSFNPNNIIYAIGEIHAYNANVFNDNVYMGDSVISPRYIIDFVFKIIMMINGGKWANAALFLLYFAVFIQALGIANISKRINEEYQVFISAIFTTLVVYCGNYLAGFNLNELPTIGMGTALAFSFLSISFLVGGSRNYKLAWIFAACAGMCHVHEGIYCCAIIFFLACADSIYSKKILWKENFAIIIAIIAIAIVVVPSTLTDSMNITDEEFVYIYSVFRHPHHLVPSTFGNESIIKTLWIDICFFTIGIINAFINNKEKAKRYVIEAVILVVAWVMALLFMYIFTEIKPIAFVSTMFVSKSFKYVLLISLVWVLEAIFDAKERMCVLPSSLIVIFAFLASSFELRELIIVFAFVVFICVIGPNYLKNKNELIHYNHKVEIVADILTFMVLLSIKLPTIGIINAGKIVLSFLVVYIIYWGTTNNFLRKIKGGGQKLLMLLACACLIVISLFDNLIVYENNSLSMNNGEKAIRYSCNDEIYDLALEFKKLTNDDTQFVGNPDDEVCLGWFSVVSERNEYVNIKVIPSSKCTVNDWYERYMLTNDFNNKSGEEIKNILEASDIEYVLVDANNFEKLDATAGVSLFLEGNAGCYRIYKLDS